MPANLRRGTIVNSLHVGLVHFDFKLLSEVQSYSLVWLCRRLRPDLSTSSNIRSIKRDGIYCWLLLRLRLMILLNYKTEESIDQREKTTERNQT